MFKKCMTCNHISNERKLKGNGFVEVLLYFFVMIIGGIAYSIWRRSGPGVCPACGHESLIPISLDQIPGLQETGDLAAATIEKPKSLLMWIVTIIGSMILGFILLILITALFI